MRREIERTEPNLPEPERRAQADRESAAVIGFISAIAAYGAFYIPKAYGSSIQLTGAADAALWGFLLFYVSCVALTWVASRGDNLAQRWERESAALELVDQIAV